MTRVTLWYRRKSSWPFMEFNHIQDGWATETRPIPSCKYQERAWSGGSWHRTFAWKIGDKVTDAPCRQLEVVP